MKNNVLISLLGGGVLSILSLTWTPVLGQDDWPTHKFEMEIGDSIENDNEDDAEAERQRVERAAQRAAKYFDAAEFVSPRLFENGWKMSEYDTPPTGDPNSPTVDPYEIIIEERVAGGAQLASYTQNYCETFDRAKSKIELSRLDIQGKADEVVHLYLAHELNHAVQFHSKFAQSCKTTRWLREALAQGAGYLSAAATVSGGIFSSTALQKELATKFRSYDDSFYPISVPADDESAIVKIGYDTGPFFLWVGMRYGGAKYLSSMYGRTYSDEGGPFVENIKWLDEGLFKAPSVKTGFDFLLPQFAADFGSWGKRLAAADVIDEDLWLQAVFGGKCPELTLSARKNIAKPYATITLNFEPMSIQCVTVHVEKSFDGPIRLDSFAYVKSGNQLKRLDSFHLSVVRRISAAGDVQTCEQHARGAKSRTWPLCVVKPFLRERGDDPTPADRSKLTRAYPSTVEIIGEEARAQAPAGTTHVRTWNSEDYIFDEPGMKVTFAITNVAPDPETSINQKDVSFVFGARSAAGEKGAQLWGPPRLQDWGELPGGLRGGVELAARAVAGEDKESLAAEAVSQVNFGYAEYGISDRYFDPASFSVPIYIPELNAAGDEIGGYQIMLVNLPPLGQTGQADAIITYYGPGGRLAAPGRCEGRDDESSIKAQIQSSSLEGVTFSVSTPMRTVDVANVQAGCRPWQPFEAEVTYPFGWRFDANTAPRDVVTPGIHAYVERYLANLREQGVPAATVKPFPGRKPEIVNVSADSSAGGQSNNGSPETLPCDCSCAAINALLKELDGVEEPTPEQLRQGACLQSCMPQAIQCRAR